MLSETVKERHDGNRKLHHCTSCGGESLTAHADVSLRACLGGLQISF